jgi:hypothetical protein
LKPLLLLPHLLLKPLLLLPKPLHLLLTPLHLLLRLPLRPKLRSKGIYRGDRLASCQASEEPGKVYPYRAFLFREQNQRWP